MIQMDTLQAVDVWFLDQEVLSVQFRAWGVEVERVERVELKALTLPQGLQRCMAAEATAAQQARAQVGNTHTHTHMQRDTHTPVVTFTPTHRHELTRSHQWQAVHERYTVGFGLNVNLT